MQGRKSLRLRRRSELLAAEPAAKLEKEPSAVQAKRKRQRRLTNQQRPANPSLQASKNVAALLQAQPIAKAVANKLRNNKGPLAAPQCNAAALQNNAAIESNGYISSGDSAKMAPGKRIKWRVAIPEEDTIRQDLAKAFLGMAVKAAKLSAFVPAATSASKGVTLRRKHR